MKQHVANSSNPSSGLMDVFAHIGNVKNPIIYKGRPSARGYTNVPDAKAIYIDIYMNLSFDGNIGSQHEP
jgi:hypothetical protein